MNTFNLASIKKFIILNDFCLNILEFDSKIKS